MDVGVYVLMKNIKLQHCVCVCVCARVGSISVPIISAGSD